MMILILTENNKSGILADDESHATFSLHQRQNGMGVMSVPVPVTVSKADTLEVFYNFLIIEYCC